METLKIAILTETVPHERLNLQPWRYLGDLARTLQAQGHEASVVTSEPGLPSWGGVPVERHEDRLAFRSGRGLRELLASKRFDGGLCRLTASLFFSFRERPSASAFGGRLAGVFLRPLHSGPDLARRFLDPVLAPEIRLDRHHAALYLSRELGTWPRAPSYVDEYVFLWDSDRRCAVSAGLPAEACTLIRHPFDPTFLRRAPSDLGSRLSDRVAPTPRRVVFAGPPEETRGVSDMIRAARHFPREEPTQLVLLVRDPRFAEPVVTTSHPGPHEVVVVRGLVSREELTAVYQRSEAAVFPYRFVRTALPLVVTEAVAAGLPVVTTRVHPLRELEGPTGLVFAEPRSPSAIAKAVRWIQEDGHRTDVLRRNEEWIQKTPDWPQVARTFASILRR